MGARYYKKRRRIVFASYLIEASDADRTKLFVDFVWSTYESSKTIKLERIDNGVQDFFIKKKASIP